MKLYILRPANLNARNDNPWDPWYNKSLGFVVRAETDKQARQFAADNAGDEGPDAWLEVRYSSCDELTDNGDASMILRDFDAA